MTSQYYPFVGGPLSNFYPSQFTIDGMNFSCGEHWMMFTKAVIFKDDEIKNKILLETNPKKIKALGRKIKNYDDDIWFKEGLESGELRRGWIEKFKQNPRCLKMPINHRLSRVLEVLCRSGPSWHCVSFRSLKKQDWDLLDGEFTQVVNAVENRLIEKGMRIETLRLNEFLPYLI